MSSASLVTRVYETVLYTDDLVGTVRFYDEVLGLERGKPLERLAVTFRLPDGGVLLLFDRSRASLPGRPVPPHGAHGPGHVAFSVRPGSLELAAARFAEADVTIEATMCWRAGGRSVYVRDPAGNSVELVDGAAWED